MVLGGMRVVIPVVPLTLLVLLIVPVRRILAVFVRERLSAAPRCSS